VPIPVAPRQIPFHAGLCVFRAGSDARVADQLKGSGGVAIYVSGEFPGLAMEFWGDSRLRAGARSCQTTTILSDVGAGRCGLARRRPTRHAGAGVPRTATAGVREFEPIPDVVRSFLGLGLNPLVQSATPLLLLTGELRHAASVDVVGLRRHVLEEIRRIREQARAAGVRSEKSSSLRVMPCVPASTSGPVDPVGRSERVGAASRPGALHREAWGGEKFFEMLRPDLRGSGHAHRSHGTAVPHARARLHGKYHMLDRAGSNWPI